jgi:glycosyltransferase involved in cell wall biosynthesis
MTSGRSSVSVVQVAHSAALYGAARSAWQHALAMREAGLASLFFLNEPGPLETVLRQSGFPCRRYPIEHFGLRRRPFQSQAARKLVRALQSRWQYLAQTRRLLVEEDRPVLHAHSAHCLLAVLGARLAGSRVVWHVREENYRGLQGLLRGLMLGVLAHRVVFVSQAVRRQYRVPEGKARVIHNFVERPPAPTAAGGPPDAPLRIGGVGMIRPAKGIFEFVEICRRLRRRQVSFTATLYGDGRPEDIQSLRDAIARAELGDAIHWAGFQHDPDAIYRSFDVLLLPTHHDALPRTVMEAMAHGLPVVATAVGGVPEMVRDGETGFLFSLADLDAAVAALTRLAGDVSLRARVGERARDEAGRRFGREEYVRAMEQVYDEVRVRRPPSHAKPVNP